MKILLRAEIKIENEKKRLVFLNPDYYKEILKKLNPKYPILIDIKNEVPRRSEKQLRFLFGVCYPTLMEHPEFEGDSPEDVHEFFKSLYAPRKFKTIKGIVSFFT